MSADWVVPAITALAGVLGVAIGGWITARNQRKERRKLFLREQLAEFYGPMLALRLKILAKSETRLRISQAADVAFNEQLREARSSGIEEVQRNSEKRSHQIESIIQCNNREFIENVLPSYAEMVTLFTLKMHLANPSTCVHFGALSEFVKVWNRWLGQSLPSEVVAKLDHSEESLHTFYKDLAETFERLQCGGPLS